MRSALASGGSDPSQVFFAYSAVVMSPILIGTSGWAYPHWRKRFYPADLPQSRWLEFFAHRFSTVEVNNTFYRLPSKTVFASWRGKSPADFLFAIKASRFITHLKRLHAVGQSVRTFLAHASELEEKLGPILFQLPPRFTRDLPRLADFLGILPSTHRYAFEFRDASWHEQATYDLLARRGVAYCIMIGPKLKREAIATADFIYLRFHAPDAGGAAFGPRRLRPWAETIRQLCAPGRSAYVFFNNDAEGAAISDALTFRDLLRV